MQMILPFAASDVPQSTAVKKIQKYPPDAKCLGKDCTKRPRARGYCAAHGWRVKKYGDPEIAAPRTPNAGKSCSADDCDAPALLYGLCAEHRRPKWNEYQRHYQQVRRARKIGAHVYDYTKEAVAQRMAYFGNRCWMCGGPFEAVDHVKPLAKGGLDCPSNLRPACRMCNCRKRDQWLGTGELHRFIKP